MNARDGNGGVRLQRWALLLGGFYDLIFAAVYVTAAQWAATAFRVPLPGHSFYLWLIAILLAMLGALYLVASRDPKRHLAVVAVAAGGRLLGALALGLTAWREPGLAGLWPLAGADAAFGLIHAAGVLTLRRE